MYLGVYGTINVVECVWNALEYTYTGKWTCECVCERIIVNRNSFKSGATCIVVYIYIKICDFLVTIYWTILQYIVAILNNIAIYCSLGMQYTIYIAIFASDTPYILQYLLQGAIYCNIAYIAMYCQYIVYCIYGSPSLAQTCVLIADSSYTLNPNNQN